MAFRLLKKWHKYRAKQDTQLVQGREVQVASARARAALRHITRHAGSPLQVPEDILYMICQYLSDPEIVVLMLSCSSFWDSRRGNGILAGAWNRIAITSSAEEDLCKMEARFYIMRMLEYDGFFQKGSSSKRFCCWGCMKTHEKQAFSDKEFEKNVDLKAKVKDDCYFKEEKARFCERAKRYIWFGACREMSFAELRHLIVHPYAQQQKQQQQKGQRLKQAQLDCGWIELRDNASSVLQEYTLFNGKRRRFEYHIRLIGTPDVPSCYWFRKHARAANLPLCPHLRTGDRAVLRLYGRPAQPHRCKHCTTVVKIGITTQYITIFAFRYVGALHSPIDPAWMAQSYRERHPYLKGHARDFCNWFENMYGQNGVATLTPGRFKCFVPSWPNRPKLKGVVRYKPEWEKGGPGMQ